MLPPPIPDNEAERVAALQSYAILDTLPEQAWNDIAVLAARLGHEPIANGRSALTQLPNPSR